MAFYNYSHRLSRPPISLLSTCILTALCLGSFCLNAACRPLGRHGGEGIFERGGTQAARLDEAGAATVREVGGGEIPGPMGRDLTCFWYWAFPPISTHPQLPPLSNLSNPMPPAREIPPHWPYNFTSADLSNTESGGPQAANNTYLYRLETAVYL